MGDPKKKPVGLAELLAINERQLIEEGALLQQRPRFAWEKAIVLDIPIFRGAEIVGSERREVQLKYAIQSVCETATNTRDRILAKGILSIIEEIEKC